ncbi:nucleotide-binding universal stress UspA family protein [Humitalea rosea]|uniref:Nucleotide-binding universal stress UspA family protein n=1 Tax=Humitalea rosea TaxID=990373 RepID=A0A2W7IC10_9PROT|nr:universal stress protein [Humitalea rosea]PZW43092.1 nucleotide-binding universal stress UspA family protein [Humitalea rosea]
MPIKDILVHLDSTPASPRRLELAAGLARRLDAHLIGLFVIDVQIPVFAGGEAGASTAMAEMMTRMQESAAAEAASAETLFRECLRREALRGEWRQQDGLTPWIVATNARYADLVIVGQPDPSGSGLTGPATVEAALFDSGRPVLMVPYAGRYEGPVRRALIAWNASREAARAVHDALPLLAGAEAVTVLVIDPDPHAEENRGEPGADIAQHLARHGLKVTVRHVIRGEISTGETLLNEAADMDADLIVMGGYGHSRLREFVLGGATRTLLGQMTAPVLMSH